MTDLTPALTAPIAAIASPPVTPALAVTKPLQYRPPRPVTVTNPVLTKVPMTKTTLALKSTVIRRPTAEPIDQAERQLQAEHHQAAENTAVTEQEAPTLPLEEPSGKQLKREAHALQSAFLAGNLGKPVTVFTVNGIRLTGKLKQFDQFTLLLQGYDGIPSLVFKHAVTTIAPAPANDRHD